MPLSKYLKISIDGQTVQLDDIEKVPVSISYKLEDAEDFQKKKSSEAFNIKIPATLDNDIISNTFHNPAVEDLSEGSNFKSHRPAVIEANGYELLVGKAFLKSASHNSQPLDYEYNFYGNNADWLIDLKETTLFDFLKGINFPFTKQQIIDSWQYDGRSESLPFVFAPVRYGNPMDKGYANLVQNPPPEVLDYNMTPVYMKPALSPYWIIYWAFKSVGYRIRSDFFDQDYFRKATLPWTWGNFLFSEGTRLNNLDFLARSTESTYYSGTISQIWDLKVSNDSSNGAFDNNAVYTYDSGTKECKWTYLHAFDYGTLEATFHINIAVDATAAGNGVSELRVQWFKNGSRVTTGNPGENGNGDVICDISAPAIGREDFASNVDIFQTFTVKPGDIISAKFYMHTFDSGLGRANLRAEVLAFELEYFRIPLGGTIDFQNYSGFKKYKFLDFLSGMIDAFNLTIQTDSVNKVVLVEPTHPYSLTNDLSAPIGGYFNGNFIDWQDKQDLSKVSTMELYSDFEKEVVFKFKDDSSDGILKVVQDRNINTVGAGKYVLPDRFKTGKMEIENRFFSPVMHYEVPQWVGLGNDPQASPQMICMIPENISNTSRDEAQNTFRPKLAWYKGIVPEVGWVFDNEKLDEFPYMFAVNYKTGGENDPVFSYSDERIGKFPTATLAKGLMRRFYLQRMAIMRNGQYYNTHFRLNNIDVTNWFHREHIICQGQKWELVEISDYRPLLEQSTSCDLRRWVPVTQEDGTSIYPTADTILDTGLNSTTYDLKYAQLKCLSSDIPQPE